MLRSNSKNLGNHVVSLEEEEERLQWEGFAEKEGFYRAMLCMRRTIAMGLCLSVSVTSRSSTKTAKRRITKTTPHDNTRTLAF